MKRYAVAIWPVDAPLNVEYIASVKAGMGGGRKTTPNAVDAIIYATQEKARKALYAELGCTSHCRSNVDYTGAVLEVDVTHKIQPISKGWHLTWTKK